MKRRKRTEILVKADPIFVQKLRKEVESRHDVKVIDEAENGLMMIKMRETAKKSLFYLGEVLTTEAKVQVNGVLGIGIIRGDEPELAYDLAVVDAAFNGRLPVTKAWERLLLTEELAINERMKQKQCQIMATKVNFDVMDT